MNSTLFKRLETCNAEHAWEHVRDVIASQLMGDNVFPVPYLGEAAQFDIGHVVLKERRSTMEKMTGVMSSALPAGQLSKFVFDERGKDLMERLGNVKKDSDTTLNQLYEFHESDMKHGVKKTITIQLWGCEKWAMDYLPSQGELIIDLEKRGYTNFDRIFLITEVFYVTEVKSHVIVGDQEDSYLIKGRIPIGFRLIRYKLQGNKALGSSKHVKKSSWGARWIKNFKRDVNDPLPFDPIQERRAL